jgi:hypothetical protein
MQKACLNYHKNKNLPHWKDQVQQYLATGKILDEDAWREVYRHSHIIHFKIGCMGMKMFAYMAPFMTQYGEDFPKWAVNYTAQFVPVTSWHPGGKQCDNAETFSHYCWETANL